MDAALDRDNARRIESLKKRVENSFEQCPCFPHRSGNLRSLARHPCRERNLQTILWQSPARPEISGLFGRLLKESARRTQQ